MGLDFTMEKYTDLCETIASSSYAPMTVRDYLEASSLPYRLVVMRHDVDVTPRNEPRMALIENDFDIRSTYYFRYKRGVFDPDTIRRIAALGHEIGFHYESLDRARGNGSKAIDFFQQELAQFRKVAEVKTISMHGNPLTRWDNRDLWQKFNYDYRDSAIVGEAYLSFRNIVYLSDTGRTWGPGYKVKDLLPSDPGGESLGAAKWKVKSTDDVIKLLQTGQFQRLYLLTHAGRWGDSRTGWLVSYLQDTAVNLVKRVIIQKALRQKDKNDE